MEDLLHGVRVELIRRSLKRRAPSRPAADFGDFGLADAARCQPRSQGQDLFLHPFIYQAFQSEA
jgi:hypothetical protein